MTTKWLARTKEWFGAQLPTVSPTEVAVAAAVVALSFTAWFQAALLGGG